MKFDGRLSGISKYVVYPSVYAHRSKNRGEMIKIGVSSPDILYPFPISGNYLIFPIASDLGT